MTDTLKIRVSAELKDKSGRLKSVPFVYQYCKSTNGAKEFTLYYSSIDYLELKPICVANSFDKLTSLLDKAGFENIELLFKDREHLEEFRSVQKKTGFYSVTKEATNKEKEEVEEGLEDLKEKLKIK